MSNKLKTLVDMTWSGWNTVEPMEASTVDVKELRHEAIKRAIYHHDCLLELGGNLKTYHKHEGALDELMEFFNISDEDLKR